MTKDEQRPPYRVVVNSPSKIEKEELKACIEIVKEGGAVNIESASEQISLACAVAIAYLNKQVVGTGSIKQGRPDYAKSIEKKSGIALPADILELGYIAVSTANRGHRLSIEIAERLISVNLGTLFATTDNEQMKKTLLKVGFIKYGKEWKGNRGKLSLWIKDSK